MCRLLLIVRGLLFDVCGLTFDVYCFFVFVGCCVICVFVSCLKSVVWCSMFDVFLVFVVRCLLCVVCCFAASCLLLLLVAC